MTQLDNQKSIIIMVIKQLARHSGQLNMDLVLVQIRPILQAQWYYTINTMCTFNFSW